MARTKVVFSFMCLLLWSGCGATSTRYQDDGGVEGDGDAEIDAEVDSGPLCLEEELCDDEIDNNCDGQVNEGCLSCPPGVEVPTEEICYDGIDNDCDGLTDDECPPLPCTCVPGSWRHCDSWDFSLPGRQFCSEDGWSWGYCGEDSMLYEGCEDISGWYSPRYVLCLIEHNQCVHDMWDLDSDGDDDESLGSCPEATCLPAMDEVCGDLWDNDLDGTVDEGCSDCLCLPGSVRWCDEPSYDMIAQQECGPDGLEWGYCTAISLGLVPVPCLDIDAWYSPQVEVCLVEHGECVQDMWDLDGDMDTWESLGDCPEPICP